MKDSEIRDIAEESRRPAEHITHTQAVYSGTGGFGRDSVVELKTISGATVYVRASRITWVQVTATGSGVTIRIDGREEQGQITYDSAVAAVAAMRRLCGEDDRPCSGPKEGEK
jgi:hypothetical protein